MSHFLQVFVNQQSGISSHANKVFIAVQVSVLWCNLNNWPFSTGEEAGSSALLQTWTRFTFLPSRQWDKEVHLRVQPAHPSLWSSVCTLSEPQQSRQALSIVTFYENATSSSFIPPVWWALWESQLSSGNKDCHEVSKGLRVVKSFAFPRRWFLIMCKDPSLYSPNFGEIRSRRRQALHSDPPTLLCYAFHLSLAFIECIFISKCTKEDVQNVHSS